jgi:hypothetical protein
MVAIESKVSYRLNAKRKHHIRVGIYMTEELHAELRVEAAQRGISMGDIITEAIRGRIILVKRPQEAPK